MTIFYSRAIKLCLISVFALSACHKPSQEWPKYVRDSLWIPKDAHKVESYVYEGMYYSNYDILICYPSRDFLNLLVREMEGRGWARRDHDYANPNIVLNHARKPSIWGTMLDKSGHRNFVWLENWQNGRGDIIEFTLIYKVEGDEISSQTCDLSVRGIYVPRERHPSPPSQRTSRSRGEHLGST